MNILFLAHRIPYPPNKGDKIRSFNEIRYLSEDHTLFLVTTLDEPEEQEYVKALKKYCKDVFAIYFHRKTRLFSQVFKSQPLSILSFWDHRIQDQVNKILNNNKVDAIIVFCSSMAQYVIHSDRFKNGTLKDVRLILDFVDMDSDKWGQYAYYAHFPMKLVYKLENKRLSQYEIELNRTFDCSVFSSEREVKAFHAAHPDARSLYAIPNGVDLEYFCPKEEAPFGKFALPKHAPWLLFTGVMDYFANEDGVIWFCEKIFPIIRQAIPEVEFYIVGNRPTDKVWALTEQEAVTVTGFVQDIRPYYWLADVCVVPLRIARGLQNKILEAMATGNAVVATSNASDGIQCTHEKDIIIADAETAFAQHVIALLQNDDIRFALADNARENVVRRYSWPINMKKFTDILGNSQVKS